MAGSKSRRRPQKYPEELRERAVRMVLEMTLAQRGAPLPTTGAGWDAASAEFASGASGNVRVLQSQVRINSTWARVEFPALKANPNVSSITAIDPATGTEVVLWTR